MRKYDVKIGEEIQWAQSEEDIVTLFSREIVTRDTPCRVSGTQDWLDVNEFFPTLKYGSPTPMPEIPEAGSPRLLVDLDERRRPAMTSSLKAGWICLAVGLAIAWIFPPAYFFFSIALILAVVAMCTHQVTKGLALLFSTFIAVGTSAVTSCFLAVGLFAAAVSPAIAKANKEIERQREADRKLMTAQQQMISSLNRTIAHPPSFQAQQATPMPIQNLSKRQVFNEIARIERQQRDLRKTGKDLPLATADYLERLKTALDAGS